MVERDRRAGGDELAADHVVEGAIDGVDGHEPASCEIKDGELFRFGGAAGNDVIVVVGEASHLELDVELIAPKPGKSAVRFAAAGDSGGDVLCLIGGVLYGFKAKMLVEGEGARVRGAVADGVDVFVLREEMIVDNDAVAGSEAGMLRELSVRLDADANENQVSGKSCGDAQLDAYRFALGGGNASDGGPAENLDTLRGVKVGEEL